MAADRQGHRGGNGIGARRLEVEERWIGPLPKPEHLAEYDSALPGAADRIFRMAEQAAGTRDAVLRDTTQAEIDLGRTGQAAALLLTFIAFTCAVVFFALHDHISGCAFLSVPVLMLIRAFLPSGSTDRQSRDN